MALAEWIYIRPSDVGTLTLIANKCSIVRNALDEWICILPSDAGTLTLSTNKCSVVQNALGRMNIHTPWPRPGPLLLPRSELHRRRPTVLPRHRAHVALRRFVWRCTCEEQGSRLPEQPQSLHRLGSSRWAKRLSTGPFPGLWYGSGGGGVDIEERWKPQPFLFQVCNELSE
jgi:hypothetical protein